METPRYATQALGRAMASLDKISEGKNSIQRDARAKVWGIGAGNNDPS